MNNKFLSALFLIVLLFFIFKSDFAIHKDNSDKNSQTKQTQVAQPPPQTTRTYRPRDVMTKNINFRILINTYISGSAEKVKFTTIIPKEVINKQKISNLQFSPQPVSVYYKDENKYADFVIEKPSSHFATTITGTAQTNRYDLDAAKQLNIPTNKAFAKLQTYLNSEQHIPSDSDYIKNIVSGISGNSQEEIARNIYNYVFSHVKYKLNLERLGVIETLQSGNGDCSEFADTLVTLLRAKGLPARVVVGYPVTNLNVPLSIGHAWAEIFLDNYGWVAVEPTSGVFDNMRNIYFYMYFKSSEETLDASSAYIKEFRYWAYHPEDVKIKFDYTVKFN